MKFNWIVEDYSLYLKRMKKPDSQERFNNFVGKCLRKKSIDPDMISETPKIFNALIRENWQTRFLLADIYKMLGKLAATKKDK